MKMHYNYSKIIGIIILSILKARVFRDIILDFANLRSVIVSIFFDFNKV